MTSPYDFRSRGKYSKRGTQKDILERKTEAAIRKSDVYGKKATAATKMPASAGGGSPVVSKDELLGNFTSEIHVENSSVKVLCVLICLRLRFPE